MGTPIQSQGFKCLETIQPMHSVPSQHQTGGGVNGSIVNMSAERKQGRHIPCISVEGHTGKAVCVWCVVCVCGVCVCVYVNGRLGWGFVSMISGVNVTFFDTRCHRPLSTSSVH